MGSLSSLLQTLCFTLASSLAFAAPSSWIKLTDRTRPHCEAKEPCVLTQEKSKKRFEITIQKTSEKKKHWLEFLFIKTEGSNPVAYMLENVQALYKSELYGLYTLDLNNDGWLDLALEASLSNRLGPMYYYWLFDSKKQKFMLTNEQIEELKLGPSQKLIGATTGTTYKITENLKIHSASTTRDKPTKQ